MGTYFWQQLLAELPCVATQYTLSRMTWKKPAVLIEPFIDTILCVVVSSHLYSAFFFCACSLWPNLTQAALCCRGEGSMQSMSYSSLSSSHYLRSSYKIPNSLEMHEFYWKGFICQQICSAK